MRVKNREKEKKKGDQDGEMDTVSFFCPILGSEGNELDPFWESKYSCEKLKFGYRFKVWLKGLSMGYLPSDGR